MSNDMSHTCHVLVYIREHDHNFLLYYTHISRYMSLNDMSQAPIYNNNNNNNNNNNSDGKE